MTLKSKYKIWNASLKRFETYPDTRPLKERRKDPFPNYHIDIHTGDLSVVVDYGNYEDPKDEIHLLQYIGKLDRYGNEICQDDIVLIGESYNNYWNVIWKGDESAFKLKSRSDGRSSKFLSKIKSQNITIVGNTKQNNNDFTNVATKSKNVLHIDFEKYLMKNKANIKFGAGYGFDYKTISIGSTFFFTPKWFISNAKLKNITDLELLKSILFTENSSFLNYAFTDKYKIINRHKRDKNIPYIKKNYANFTLNDIYLYTISALKGTGDKIIVKNLRTKETFPIDDSSLPLIYFDEIK